MVENIIGKRVSKLGVLKGITGTITNVENPYYIANVQFSGEIVTVKWDNEEDGYGKLRKEEYVIIES